MKKPKAVVRIENLSLSLREKVDRLLDENTPAIRISGDLRGNDGVQIAPGDIAEYAAWREIVEVQPGGETAPQGPETRYTPETLTREHITYAIKEKVITLIEEARKDPSSDATKLIEALLLQAMTNQELGTAEKDLKTVFELQRKNKEAEHKYKNAHLSLVQTEKNLALKKKEVEAQMKQIAAKTKETEANTEQIKAKTEALNRVAQVTVEMQQAQAQGKPWDHLEVVRKISAAIGMGQGLVERVEPQQQL
ncbi:MAG TPA: hypothetical protein VGW33_09240 [Terriglobia bacterium]|nr:hypothetical protein [Terriglobia bacterium]